MRLSGKKGTEKDQNRTTELAHKWVYFPVFIAEIAEQVRIMHKYDIKTFQGLILALQDYWARQGCVIVQPLDMEVGAAAILPIS